MDNKIKLEKMSGLKFTYDLHSMDNSNLPFETAFGYNLSCNVPVLQKKNMVCVMMFDEGRDGDFWVHLTIPMFEKYFTAEEEIIEEEQSLKEFELEFERINWEHFKEDSKARFLFEHGLSDAFEKNIKATQNNVDGLMHFVKLDINSNCGWWSFDKEEFEMNPEDVKVVNQVGGYHYRDFTRPERIYIGRDSEGKSIYEERDYEFISCKSRRDLPKVGD